jgi:MFS transporter, CP family, cyanate transporter
MAPYTGPLGRETRPLEISAAAVAAAPETRPALLRLVGTIALLWLVGMALRLTVLAIAPLLPMVHRDLALSETAIGTLGSLPMLLFACAAVPGALLIARFGAKATVVVGLCVTALGCALRGAAPDVLLLYGATIVMGAGIAVMHPALPPLVRDWMPDRIGFATAVYSNGLLIAELIAVALAIPLVLPLAHGSWRLSLVLWALPIVLTAALVVSFSPRAPAVEDAADHAAARVWWPDWRDPLVWRLGFLLGSVNTIYWTANTFLPDYLVSLGRAALVPDVLTALNGGQIPGSLLMLLMAGRAVRRHGTYVMIALLVLGSLAGILLGSASAIVWCAGILGCANAVALILMLALPALLGASEDVHRVSAAMFTISYSCAVVLPILAGFIWDVTGIAALAFAPIAISGLAILALAPGLGLRSAPHFLGK